MPALFNAINATSDAGGNPAIISVRAIGLSTAGNIVVDVTRGPANPAADLIIDAAINEYSGFSGNGITQIGNGILLLTASNNYNGPTTISGGTLQLGTGQSRPGRFDRQEQRSDRQRRAGLITSLATRRRPTPLPVAEAWPASARAPAWPSTATTATAAARPSAAAR